MVDFKQALSIGFDAAEKAKNNQQEIDNVFLELNNQINEVTKGQITIDRSEFSAENTLDIIGTIDSVFKNIGRAWGGQVITAKNEKFPEKVKKLAKWEKSNLGYPCKLTYSNQLIICEDKEALESALAEMLTDPDIGRILYSLYQLSEFNQVLEQS